jgi:small subunit ribosomal protein S8
MSLTDPIADYLTRIRNAASARHSKVDIPSSKITREITRILKDEGYIHNFTFIDDQKQGIIRIYLKYDNKKKCAITGIQRVSRPGFRRYFGVDEIPRVLNGLGIAILSTPKGILTDVKARSERVGGEILCNVW